MRYDDATVNDILPELRKILAEQVVETEVKDEYSDNVRTIRSLPRGLLLKGITGCGKTHTLHAIRSVVKNWGQDCTRVENWVYFLSQLKQDNFAKEFYLTERMISSKFIFIDDLGAEKEVSAWADEKLYTIINEAYNRGQTLFISTNLTDEQFSKRYGDRIQSRIGQVCLAVEMPDKDWRLEKIHGKENV